jgi:alpha-1,2-mannosyltransferase
VRSMRRVSPSRVARVPGPWSALALYGVSLGVLLVSHLGHGWGFVDLHIYERGGAAVRAGAPLYALRFPGALAFTYPPFAALALAGVTLAPNALLEPLFTGISVALLPLLLFLTLRLDRRSSSRPLQAAPNGGGRRAAPNGGDRLPVLDTRKRLALALALSAAALWLEPVWTTLRYGQIDLLLATLVVWDMGREDGARTKGLGIGLAAAIKLTPAIFAVYLLASGRRRAALVSAGTFAATVALGYLTLPGDSREYWGGAFAEAGRVGRIENAANQSLRGALSRVLHTPHVGGVWVCVAVLVALTGLALALDAARRGDDARGFSVCALTALLISPVSWSHHWVLAVPALVLFALDARRHGSSAVVGACALAAVLAYAHVIWWVPINHPLHSELHLNALQLLFADAYVLVALLALAGMAVARISTPCILVSGHAPLERPWTSRRVGSS